MQLPKHRTEFFEVNKCNFVYPYEPQIMFNIMRHQLMFKRLRYVSISRCKLCQGFIIPALRSFLMEDENIKRFSFVLNNQAQPILEDSDSEEEDPGKKNPKKKISRLSNTIEKEM